MTMPQDREAVAEEVAEQRKLDEEATAAQLQEPDAESASADQAAEANAGGNTANEAAAPPA